MNYLRSNSKVYKEKDKLAFKVENLKSQLRFGQSKVANLKIRIEKLKGNVTKLSGDPKSERIKL